MPMPIGFAKLKLSVRLTLLFLFPLIFSIALLTYFLEDTGSVTMDLWLIAIGFVLLLGYAIAAFLFLRDLVTGIKKAEQAASDLALGKFFSNGVLGNLQEVNGILQSIKRAGDDFHAYEDFAEQIMGGNLSSSFKLKNEHDRLGRALEGIKENLITIQKEDDQRKWTSDGLAKFVRILQSATNLKQLSSDIIINLVRTVGANQGAIFILTQNNNEEVLEMQACYAFDRSKHLTQRISPGEGLIGQVFLEKQTVYLKDVPEQFIRITSGLGASNPRHVLIVPLKMNESVVGVAELASFTEFGPHVVSFIEKIGESIAHAVTSFRTAEDTKNMLAESKAQAEEMRAQEEELRQNQEELQATQEAISRKYDALFKQLGELNDESKFDQLKSITSTKKRNIEYYFDIIRNQILTFSEDLMVIEAIKAFRNAFYKIDDELAADTEESIRSSVLSYYSSEFIPKLNNNVSKELKITEYLPEEMRTLLYQYLYISNNPHPTGSKSLLDAPGDGSEYAKAHALYHPIMRNFLEKFGYYDIFLIDARTGYMLYSVFKEVDFATNLLEGPYSNTNFGRVVREAIENNDKKFVKLIDFEAYDPSYHAPASFIASAVYDGDEKLGILVFQMPINKINQILTGNNKWREDGLGDTGETFIVGDDYKLRSISRPLIENLEEHLSQLKGMKYSREVIQQMRTMQTNILMEEMKTSGVTQALKGVTGTSLDKNAFDEQILTAFAPLNIPDVHWVIMSAMKEEEASLRIRDLREKTV